jgi:NitT/TauT family transport system substrate-binding protein
VIAGLAVVALTGTSCGSSGGGAGGGGSSSGPTTVTVGTLPIANAAAMYLGMQKGFFKDQNITVNPKVAQGGNEIITSMVSGSDDIGFIGYVPLGVAASQNVPVCMVSASDDTGTSEADDFAAIVVGARSPITSPQALAGKTIGVNALRGVAEVITKAALQKDGVDPSSVKLIEIPFPQVPAALAAGRIDAGYATEPFLTQVLDQGGKALLAPGATIAPHYPNGLYAASKQFVAKSGDVVKRFKTAMDRSVDYAQQHPDEARASIPTFTKIPADIASRIRLPYWSSKVDNGAIDQQMGFLKQFGIVDKAPKSADMMCG